MTSQNGDGAPACVWPELDMKGWTHFSSWRLWFTCNIAANSRAPLSEISLDPRLQMSENKRWGVVQQTSSLCVRYIWSQYLTTETHYQTLCVSLSVSEVEDYYRCGY